jgi:hypothetical protein
MTLSYERPSFDGSKGNVKPAARPLRSATWIVFEPPPTRRASDLPASVSIQGGIGIAIAHTIH